MPILETLMVSAIAGYIFYSLHFPIPWMLGPMTAMVVWNWGLHREVRWPGTLRNAALMILGYVMGISFTPETTLGIIKHFPTMLLATLLLMAFSISIAYMVRKKTGDSLQTCVMGCIPGGFTQMVLMSGEIAGTNVTTVTFLQTIRLLSVVSIVPFLATHGFFATRSPHEAINLLPVLSQTVPLTTWLLYGSIVGWGTWLAMRFHVPTPYMLGPLLGAAVLGIGGFEAPRLPQPVLVAAQLSAGIYMGLSLEKDALRNWKQMLPLAMLSGVGVVAISLGIAYLLAQFYGIDFITAFLSTAPGGLTEMGITAINVGADLSIVTSYQMFRLFFILFIIPAALRRCFGTV